MSLYFDDQGNLFPYQKSNLKISECWDLFVNNFPASQTRQTLFDNLLRYRSAIFSELNQNFTQWINGSFATQKLNPNDIDIANLIPYNDALDSKIETVLPYFTVGSSLETYQMDAHLIPVYDQTDPRFENTKLRLAYFEHWFGHDRNDNPKGFIEINEPW